MKKAVLGAVLAVASTAVGAYAQSDYGLVIHMTAPDYSNCNLFEDVDTTCEDVNTVGTTLSGPNYAWVLAYGYDQIPGWPTAAADRNLGGVQFGLKYPDTVTYTGDFAICTGGSIIIQDDFLGRFPDSGTACAVTWGGGSYDSPSPEKFAKVGFMLVNAGSIGTMSIQGDARVNEDEVLFTNSGAPQEWAIGPNSFSNANVDGTVPTDGRAACREAVPTVEKTWGDLKSLF